MAVTRQQAAALLRQYAVMVELLGEDPFRARTFDNAARLLEAQTAPLNELVEQNLLTTIRGFGKTLSAAVTQIYHTGTFADLEISRARIPSGVLDLLRVEGLGPKKARALWQDAQITSLEELEQALDRGVIVKLPGFGAKSADKLRASLAFLKSIAGRHLRHHALRAADQLRSQFSAVTGVQEVFIGGSLRRGCETIRDLDLIVIAAARYHDAIRAHLAGSDDLQWLSRDEPIWKGKTAEGVEIELSVATTDHAPLQKFFATGSAAHVAAVVELAQKRGFTLTPGGFTGPADVRFVIETEANIYERLGLEPVPPPLRENATTLHPHGTFAFPKSVELAEIRGIIHCHTTASDGHHSLRELAEAMISSGFEYLGIADHSQAAAYANGLSPDRVRQQWSEIDTMNAELAPFRILKGIEVDILTDGRLDYDETLLAGFDFVIASIHSGFNMTEDDATTRLCRALENPHVDILGHVTGRLLLERPGYPVKHERIIECAARHGKGIELNCNPHRLDLDWRWLAACVAANVPVPLCPDAHDLAGLGDVRYGIDVAAKGPLIPSLCPSTWGTEEFVHWCRSHSNTP